MRAIDFVKRLKRIPTNERVKSLKNKKLPDDFIDEYLASYLFKEVSSQEYHDELKNLILNYDGSGVKIGMITFDIEPEEDESYFVFGRFEVDYLAENRNLKTIEMLEYGTEDYVLYECAQNASSFLEAILEAAKFMEKKGFDDDLYNDQTLCNQVAEECGKIAGGPQYYDFYKMIVGCD